MQTRTGVKLGFHFVLLKFCWKFVTTVPTKVQSVECTLRGRRKQSDFLN
jgi:hypothetical protein